MGVAPTDPFVKCVACLTAYVQEAVDMNKAMVKRASRHNGDSLRLRGTGAAAMKQALSEMQDAKINRGAAKVLDVRGSARGLIPEATADVTECSSRVGMNTAFGSATMDAILSELDISSEF